MSTEITQFKSIDERENDVFGIANMPCRMNSIRMVTNSNCLEYILYVSSKDRINSFTTPKLNEISNNWYYIGTSDSGVLSWYRYPESAIAAQRYLETSVPGGKIVKIIFTKEIDINSPPICQPYHCFNGKYMKFKHQPLETICHNNIEMSIKGIIDCDSEWKKFIFDFSRKKYKMTQTIYY
jgi:hypothetical protein